MNHGFNCGEVEHFVDAYIDQEFSAEDRAMLEDHVARCARCAHLLRAQIGFKTALRAAAPRPAVSDVLRQRVRAALDAEQAVGRRTLGRRLAWGVLPAMAAAALAVSWTVRSEPDSSVVTEAIERHRRDLPVEVSGGDDQVRAWFAHKVDFAVRPPQLPNAALVGGRLGNIRDRQAADLVYMVGGEKVSVFVFDPGDMPLGGSRRRQVQGRDIFFGGRRGYQVAMFQDRGVGYVFASDMDEERMLQLVSGAALRR